MRVWAINLALLLAAMTSSAQVLDAIVARVDRGVITWSGVVQEQALHRLTGQPGGMLSAEVVREALIERRLLAAEAAKLRLRVDPLQVRREVEQLAADAGGDVFWQSLAELGLRRKDLEEWSAQRALVLQYQDLLREMTFVPEAEVRDYYAEHANQWGNRPLAEMRDEVRVRLAQDRYREELRQWVQRQKREGRVHLLPLPAAANSEHTP